MEDFRGGKFIVGSDMRGDEQRRMANEYFRNQNENQREANESSRNEATSNALGIANTHSRSNFLTQIGLFTAVVLTVIILGVIAILAYHKATNNQSLVDLDNLRDLTLTTLTVNDTALIKGIATLEDELVSTGGVSTTLGLSVGGITNLYGNLVSTGGVSTTLGLSVGGITNLYGNLVSTGGVSTTLGLSVGGITNLYGNLVSTAGISTTGGLSVGGTARIEVGKTKRECTILTTSTALIDGGVSGGLTTGYQLTEGEGGTTFIIQNEDADEVSIRNSFILPEVTNDFNGLTYDFLWGINQSGPRRSFELMTPGPTLDERLMGNVMAGQNGTSVITMTLINDDEAPHNTAITGAGGTSTPTLFHYEGTVYPGSKLTCTYVNNNWQLYGTMGISTDYISNNGFVNTSELPWFIGGTSDNGTHSNKYIGSYTGTHFYSIASNLQDTLNQGINTMTYGVSSDGTSIWNAGTTTSTSGTKTIHYSINGVSFTDGRGSNLNLYTQSIAYGACTTDRMWTATGWNVGGTTPANNILYSTDGVSWNVGTGANFGAVGYGFGIAYGLSSDGTSMWVATGTDGFTGSTLTKNFLYSTDGVSWENGTGASFTGGIGNAVAYGLSSDGTTGIWSAIGTVQSGTNSILYSLNGVSWDYTTGANFGIGDSSENRAGVAYGLSSDGTTGTWVAVSKNGSTDNNILYSLDGISWDYTTGDYYGAAGIGSAVVYGKDNNDTGLWVTTGHHSTNAPFANIITSTNGVAWTLVNTGVDLHGGEAGRAIGFNKVKYPNVGNPVDN